MTSLSPAQSSHSSSSTAGSGSLKSSTKPLTPKSAMPGHRKTTTAAPKATGTTNTTAQLSHLERQNRKANSPKSPGTASSKDATLKSGSLPAGKSSAIDFKYQKPVGAPKAAKGSKSP
jgi:hypothetical protein